MRGIGAIIKRPVREEIITCSSCECCDAKINRIFFEKNLCFGGWGSHLRKSAWSPKNDEIDNANRIKHAVIFVFALDVHEKTRKSFN